MQTFLNTIGYGDWVIHFLVFFPVAGMIAADVTSSPSLRTLV